MSKMILIWNVEMYYDKDHLIGILEDPILNNNKKLPLLLLTIILVQQCLILIRIVGFKKYYLKVETFCIFLLYWFVHQFNVD